MAINSQKTFLTTAVMLIGNILLYYVAAYNGIKPSDYFAFNVAFGVIMGAFNALAATSLLIAQINPMLSMIEPILSLRGISS